MSYTPKIDKRIIQTFEDAGFNTQQGFEDYMEYKKQKMVGLNVFNDYKWNDYILPHHIYNFSVFMKRFNGKVYKEVGFDKSTLEFTHSKFKKTPQEALQMAERLAQENPSVGLRGLRNTPEVNLKLRYSQRS